MDYKLEVVPVPVSDVDRAKAFYTEQVGFNCDLDDTFGPMRIIQLTPPGSGCSICIGTGVVESEPGSLRRLQLVVADIEAAVAECRARGLDISNVQHFENGEYIDGKGGRWNSWAFFSDPDGNTWVLQESP